MINEFIDTWPLFSHTFLSGFLAALLLSLVGIILVARDQIFLGIAASQFSVLGVSTGLFLLSSPLFAFLSHDHMNEAIHHPFWLSLIAIFFTTLGVFLSQMKFSSHESYESLTGWLFLMSTSLTILLVSKSPYDLEEIQRLFSSTVIGATPADTFTLLLITASSFLFMTLLKKPLCLFLLDPLMAQVCGLNKSRWNIILALILGTSMGISVRISGVLFTFGCLILPPLAAKVLSKNLSSLFWLSPLIAGFSTLGGFILAIHYDFPLGHMVIFILAMVLILSWIFNRFWTPYGGIKMIHQKGLSILILIGLFLPIFNFGCGDKEDFLPPGYQYPQNNPATEEEEENGHNHDQRLLGLENCLREVHEDNLNSYIVYTCPKSF